VEEAGSSPLHFFTTAHTVGEALYQAGIILYLADQVRPSFSSPIEPGTRIAIDRSVPVTVQVDGQTLRTRTHRVTVGDVLSDMGVSLQGLDYAEPDLIAPLGEGREIRVVRVQEELLVQQELIAFESQWVPNPDLEIDHQQLGQQGEPGVFERRIRVRYEDGVEVKRWVEAEWVAKTPRNKILEYGTKIVLRTVDTPVGPREYWRKFRMLATSYTAASAGKPADHPYYGITALGWEMRKGIVAVDPRIVRLGTQVFVPGYGIGDAADTGGAIRNLRIDLGYDDNNFVSWYRCVDVYLLAPVPDRVEYVLSSLVHPWCQ
jgi:3D (Asp-Asp-Asp) domain-containing protein